MRGADAAFGGDVQIVQVIRGRHPGHDVQIVQVIRGRQPGHDAAVTGLGNIPGVLRCICQGVQEGHGCDLLPAIFGAEDRKYHCFLIPVQSVFALIGHRVGAQEVCFPS